LELFSTAVLMMAGCGRGADEDALHELISVPELCFGELQLMWLSATSELCLAHDRASLQKELDKGTLVADPYGNAVKKSKGASGMSPAQRDDVAYLAEGKLMVQTRDSARARAVANAAAEEEPSGPPPSLEQQRERIEKQLAHNAKKWAALQFQQERSAP
jgi:hypothetical protein